MPRTVSVTLGGQEYQIAQLPMRENRLWRNSLGQPVMRLIEALQGMGDLELTGGNLADLALVFKELLLGSMDILLDALFAYSVALSSDRERIEAEAYDDEALAALVEVVRLAYPLDRALTGLGGLSATRTSTNSPLPNGVNGTKKPTAGRPRSTTKT